MLVCFANIFFVEFLTRVCSFVHILPLTKLFHSSLKALQEASWEFLEIEIELVLTQAQQKAVAGAQIIVQDKLLSAREIC